MARKQSGEARETGAVSYQDRIIDALTKCENLTAPQEAVLGMVKGKNVHLHEAIQQLTEHGVVVRSGTPHSPTNPLKLTLKPEALRMHDMSNGRFEPRAIVPGGYSTIAETLSEMTRVRESNSDKESDENDSNAA